MSKTKIQYVCSSCGAAHPKWMGRCNECDGWNTLTEEIAPGRSTSDPSLSGYAGEVSSEIVSLENIPLESTTRLATGFNELDRVLGGGLVPGSVVLIGGDPGIGKSTLLLQAIGYLAKHNKVLYVTGEESLQQIAMRASRLQCPIHDVPALAETNVEKIVNLSLPHKPGVIVIDSIQTIHTEFLPSAPGSVGQVRESAARLVRFAKSHNIALFFVGHVTKEGALAGPRVLEHMVDAVLYFEGEKDNRFRILRSIKNRFGAVNEIGVFAMQNEGLKEVKNPSAIFLTRSEELVSGSGITVIWEGTRPLLVEVQALVDQSHLGNPRRVTVGIDSQRLSLLLAVLNRHGGIATYDQDVFVNVVGGVRISETSADLAILLSTLSSLRDKPLPNDWVFIGEVGLAGEIRPVSRGQERIAEASKHGFKQAIIPKGNRPQPGMVKDMICHPVATVAEAIQLVQ